MMRAANGICPCFLMLETMMNKRILIEGSQSTEALDAFLKDWLSDSDHVICKTSGSTGEPKHIPVSKKAMRYSAQTTVDFFGLNAAHTALLCLPCDFIAGRMMVVRALLSGMQLHSVIPSADPLSAVFPYPIHFAAFTPPQVHNALSREASSGMLRNISSVIIGGAPLPQDVENRLVEHGVNAYVTYGMTETISHVALRKVGESNYKLISEGTRISIDDFGCLVLENTHLFDGALVTRDVVEILDHNTFRWLGRSDFVINSGGFKIHPEQVEQKISQHPDWKGIMIMVAAEPHPIYGERPVLIGLKEAQLPSLHTLENTLSKREMPAKLIQVDSFVFTENGKINRALTTSAARTQSA